MIALLLPLGLFLGLLLSVWRSGSDMPSERGARGTPGRPGLSRYGGFVHWLLSSPLRASFWPVLSLAIGVWLPAALCIYRESPDWSLAYLIPPERASPVVLAAVFTVLALTIPSGFAVGLFFQYRLALLALSANRSLLHLRLWRATPVLLLVGLGCGILGLVRLWADRLLWLGSYADFHDGRWLLLPLWGGGSCSLRVVTVAGVSLVAVGVGLALTVKALHMARETALRALSDDDVVGSLSNPGK